MIISPPLLAHCAPQVDSPLPAPPPARPPPPARRLVLFVADGLRAESFYQEGAAPFLHSVGRGAMRGNEVHLV